jgi:DNA-binding FrmR family transcriptional regulator
MQSWQRVPHLRFLGLTEIRLPYTPIPYAGSSVVFCMASEELFCDEPMKMKHVRPGLEKRALIIRLRRIKGQVEGLERMIEGDADCSDVLMQVVSARQALKSFSQEVIEAHMHECIEGAANQAEGKREIRALLEVLKRYAT